MSAFAYRAPAWRPALAQQTPGAPAVPPASLSPSPQQGVTPVVMMGAGAGLGMLAGAVVCAAIPKIRAPKWASVGLLSIGGLLGLAAIAFPVFDATGTQRNGLAFAGGAAAALGAKGVLYKGPMTAAA